LVSDQSLHDTPTSQTSDKSDANAVGCQDSLRGINRTYVELRYAQVVNLNLKMSYGFRERRIYVVLSVPTNTAAPALNSTKQRPVQMPYTA
jgi:hypothetical protein